MILNENCLTWLLMCLFIATTNCDQQVDEVSNVSLEVQDYLNKICNGSATCHLVNSVPENYRNLGVRNCMCDNQCPTYNDCCTDAPFANSSRSKSTTFECIETMIDGHIYMVTSCLPSTLNSTSPVIQMCLNPDPKLMAVDVLLSTPVTNANTGKTYRNVFCALCNNDREYHVWDIFVSYDGLLQALRNGTKSLASKMTSMKSADNILNTIRPGNKSLFWQFTNENASMYGEICYLNSTIPKNLSTVVRTCIPNVIDTCAPNWIDSMEEPLLRKCIDNDLTYVSIGNKTYKNRFCAECNNILYNSTKICINASRPRFNKTFYQPFTVSITDKRILKTPTSCAELQKSFPQQEQCHVPTPKKISTKKRSQCFPVRKDTNRPCLVAETLLKNSSDLTFVNNEQFVIYRNNKYKYREEFFDLSISTIYICGSYFLSYSNKFVRFVDDILTWVLIKLSIICLLLHLLIFQQLPEMRNLSGKNLTCFALTLIVFLISFELGPSLRGWLGSCRGFGIVLHYSLLSCFAWVLIMSYDCWLSLFRATAQFRLLAGKGHSIRFAIYCLMCWTAPMPLVGYGMYLEFWSTDNYCSLQPGYGLSENCFIFNNHALHYLLIIPASISFLGNILFFAHTAYIIYLSQCKSVNPNTRNHFILYIRLALMMGLTLGFAWILRWLMIIIDSPVIGLMFTIMNMSQGIFIFFGFTFKKKYIKLLLNKYSGNVVLTNILSMFVTSSHSPHK